MRALPSSRPSRARSWFYANWGYEESKHSLALGDWLLKAGMRTEEQLTDLEGLVFSDLWLEIAQHTSHVALLAYAMVQERATGLNYRNLRRRAQERGGDPALEQLLMFISVDEQAHHSFFQDAIKLHLDHDRAWRRLEPNAAGVMNGFAHAGHFTVWSVRPSTCRCEDQRSRNIFNDDLYYQEVYLPTLCEAAGVSPAEMRQPRADARNRLFRDRLRYRAIVSATRSFGERRGVSQRSKHGSSSCFL